MERKPKWPIGLDALRHVALARLPGAVLLLLAGVLVLVLSPAEVDRLCEWLSKPLVPPLLPPQQGTSSP